MISDTKLPFPNKYFQVLGKKKILVINHGKKYYYSYASLATWLEKLIFYFEPELKE